MINYMHQMEKKWFVMVMYYFCSLVCRNRKRKSADEREKKPEQEKGEEKRLKNSTIKGDK